MIMIECESKHWRTTLSTDRPQWLFKTPFNKFKVFLCPIENNTVDNIECLLSTTLEFLENNFFILPWGWQGLFYVFKVVNWSHMHCFPTVSHFDLVISAPIYKTLQGTRTAQYDMNMRNMNIAKKLRKQYTLNLCQFFRIPACTSQPINAYVFFLFQWWFFCVSLGAKLSMFSTFDSYMSKNQ